MMIADRQSLLDASLHALFFNAMYRLPANLKRYFHAMAQLMLASSRRDGR